MTQRLVGSAGRLGLPDRFPASPGSTRSSEPGRTAPEGAQKRLGHGRCDRRDDKSQHRSHRHTARERPLRVLEQSDDRDHGCATKVAGHQHHANGGARDLRAENLGLALRAAGADFSDILKVTVFMTDISRRAEVNEVRKEYFGAALPASTLIEVSALALPGLLVEIEAIAGVGGGR